jgi:hypothetical protein
MFVNKKCRNLRRRPIPKALSAQQAAKDDVVEKIEEEQPVTATEEAPRKKTRAKKTELAVSDIANEE